MPRQRTLHGPPLRFFLTAAQVRQVESIAAGLPSEEQRHSFRLRVGAKLKLSAPIGGVPDQLLDACIDSVLKELGGAAAA